MDEKTSNSLLQRKLTMKITYERLNQIIEEEVVKFKKLNEGARDEVESAIQSTTDISKLKTALRFILSNVKDDTQLQSIANSLRQK